MTRIYSIAEEVGAARSFQSTTNGIPTEVKVVGLMLTDGKNKLYAEAFRERADLVEKLQLQKGDIVELHLSTNATCREKDGNKFYNNMVTVDGIMVLVRNSF